MIKLAAGVRSASSNKSSIKPITVERKDAVYGI
jgi:hypothetical protein